MSVFETIKHRQSIGKMTNQVPTRTQIEQLLEAATHAPNHHKVQPWHFFILAGKAREELGAIMTQSLAEQMEDTNNEKAQAQLIKERNKPLRSPIIIIVASEYPKQDNILDIENVVAVAAAVENMLLVAEELGLAAMWRTGNAAYNPHIKKWLGLSLQDHIISILYLGYPAIKQPARTPQPITEKTTWLGWEPSQ